MGVWDVFRSENISARQLNGDASKSERVRIITATLTITRVADAFLQIAGDRRSRSRNPSVVSRQLTYFLSSISSLEPYRAPGD
jgi:hypothetical protein